MLRFDASYYTALLIYVLVHFTTSCICTFCVMTLNELLCFKPLVANLFVAMDRSALGNFTAAWEYSMMVVIYLTLCTQQCFHGNLRINRSHAQAPSGVTTSIHYVISPSGSK